MTLSFAQEEGSPLSFTAFDDMIRMTCPKSIKNRAETEEPIWDFEDFKESFEVAKASEEEQQKVNGMADKSTNLLDLDDPPLMQVENGTLHTAANNMLEMDD